jgi:hypothetical protein
MTTETCCHCKYWRRASATDGSGRVIRGFLAACDAPYNRPSDAPWALKMVSTNWDDGQGCPHFKLWDLALNFRVFGDDD